MAILAGFNNPSFNAGAEQSLGGLPGMLEVPPLNLEDSQTIEITDSSTTLYTATEKVAVRGYLTNITGLAAVVTLEVIPNGVTPSGTEYEQDFTVPANDPLQINSGSFFAVLDAGDVIDGICDTADAARLQLLIYKYIR